MSRTNRVLPCLMTTLLLLSGCAAPLHLYHQPGVPVGQMQRTLLDCQVTALDNAPVATQVRREPARYVPARRFCDSAGNCTYRGGYFVNGEVYSVDVNADLRERVERQSMADRGYTYVALPNCASGIAAKVPVAATEVLPRLMPTSCAIRNEDGTWQIVTVAP